MTKKEIHAHFTLSPEQEDLSEEEQEKILGGKPQETITYQNGARETFGQVLAEDEVVDTAAAANAIEAGTIQGFGFGQKNA